MVVPPYSTSADGLRLRSGRVLVRKYTVRRLGFERSQSRIEAEPRPAVRTEDHVSIAHIDVNVRVVLRRGRPDAFEFSHANVDFRDAVVAPELQIAAVSLVVGRDDARNAGDNGGGRCDTVALSGNRSVWKSM